jgi:hypothetical protein
MPESLAGYGFQGHLGVRILPVAAKLRRNGPPNGSILGTGGAEVAPLNLIAHGRD